MRSFVVREQMPVLIGVCFQQIKIKMLSHSRFQPFSLAVLFQDFKPLFGLIYIITLLFCLSDWLFGSNSRQNGLTNQTQMFCRTSHDPREGLDELKTLEWWISGLMLNSFFFLISRLYMACSPHEFNLQRSQQIRIKDIKF